MSDTIFNEDVLIRGTLRTRAFVPPSQCITNAAVEEAAGIDADKLEHQHSINIELFGPTTSISALTKLLYIVYGTTATIVNVEAAVVTKATGADRTVTVDLKRSTAGGAFATVLSATIGFTDGSTNLTPVTGTITSASLVDGDLLEATVAVAGSAGNQALGLLLTLTVREDAD